MKRRRQTIYTRNGGTDKFKDVLNKPLPGLIKLLDCGAGSTQALCSDYAGWRVSATGNLVFRRPFRRPFILELP